jgi:hypothetical protein
MDGMLAVKNGQFEVSSNDSQVHFRFNVAEITDAGGKLPRLWVRMPEGTFECEFAKPTPVSKRRWIIPTVFNILQTIGLDGSGWAEPSQGYENKKQGITAVEPLREYLVAMGKSKPKPRFWSIYIEQSGSALNNSASMQFQFPWEEP